MDLYFLGGIGETLISAGDLNDYTKAGDYYCNGGGGTIGHIPDTNIAAFRMEVRSTNGSGRVTSATSRRVYQILHPRPFVIMSSSIASISFLSL